MEKGDKKKLGLGWGWGFETGEWDGGRWSKKGGRGWSLKIVDEKNGELGFKMEK